MSKKSFTVEARAVKELVQWVTKNATALKAHAGQVQVQQVPMDSYTVGTKVVEEQMKQEPTDFPTLEGEDVQDQVQEEPLDSGENNLYVEQDKSIQIYFSLLYQFTLFFNMLFHLQALRVKTK